MKRFSIFLILLIFSCGKPKVRSHVSIGIDPNLPQIQSIETKNNVMGFIQDLLKEIKGINFYFVNDDTKNLTKGLSEKKYDLILSSLLPYNFNEEEYNFSKVVIPLAPYPVIRKAEKIKTLSDFKNKIIGIQDTDLGLIDFKKLDNWNLKIYTSVLAVLNELVDNKIDIALISYLDALSYVEDTFNAQVQMLDIPLNTQGYRFISLKKHHSNIIRQLSDKLNNVKKDNALLEKWKLKIRS